MIDGGTSCARHAEVVGFYRSEARDRFSDISCVICRTRKTSTQPAAEERGRALDSFACKLLKPKNIGNRNLNHGFGIAPRVNQGDGLPIEGLYIGDEDNLEKRGWRVPAGGRGSSYVAAQALLEVAAVTGHFPPVLERMPSRELTANMIAGVTLSRMEGLELLMTQIREKDISDAVVRGGLS